MRASLLLAVYNTSRQWDCHKSAPARASEREREIRVYKCTLAHTWQHQFLLPAIETSKARAPRSSLANKRNPFYRHLSLFICKVRRWHSISLTRANFFPNHHPLMYNFALFHSSAAASISPETHFSRRLHILT
jgi:hypothetical protein